MRDSKKGESGEYVELDKGLWPEDVVAAPEAAAPEVAVAAGGDVEMGDEEEMAEMPAPFEYPFED